MNDLTTMTPSWLNRSIYPFSPRSFKSADGRMSYVDEGAGSGLPIVFVHGTPTWSFLYRRLIEELSEKRRCIAVDHFGFGLSDKPAGAPYHPEDHSRRLKALLDELEIPEFVLVVHDFGGPIGLDLATRHARRVRGLMIFNTWMWSEAENDQAKKLSRFVAGPVGRFLYKWLNFSPRVLLKMGFHDKSKLSREVHRHYLRPFGNSSEREGPWRLGCELASTWYDGIWERREAIARVPTQILWGMEDKAFQERHLQKLEGVFHNAETLRLEGVGHFPQEEAPQESIGALRRLLERVDAEINEVRDYE